ncbi:MAG: T9SS type A sorting domain-containing protein, partial [Flavobacteriaceae bacterium]
VYTDVLTAANGCDSTVTTDLTVMPAITSSQTLVECDGFSITVGTNTYNSTGVYTDVLTAANGCDSTVTTDLTVLSVITSSQTLVECEGFSITVGTNTYNTTGVYTDVLTNVNGCDSTVTTDLTINTLPIVSISPFNPDTICLTDAVFDLPVGTLMGGTYSGAGVVDTTFDPNTAGVGSHYIVYSYTDANSCTNSDSTMITVDLCLGVEEESTISDLNVYPNPTTGMVYIDLGNHNEAVSYSISNIGGQVINQEVNVITDRIAIDLSNESKGIYLLKVESNTTTNVYKVIRK